MLGGPPHVTGVRSSAASDWYKGQSPGFRHGRQARAPRPARPLALEPVTLKPVRAPALQPAGICAPQPTGQVTAPTIKPSIKIHACDPPQLRTSRELRRLAGARAHKNSSGRTKSHAQFWGQETCTGLCQQRQQLPCSVLELVAPGPPSTRLQLWKHRGPRSPGKRPGTQAGVAVLPWLCSSSERIGL